MLACYVEYISAESSYQCCLLTMIHGEKHSARMQWSLLNSRRKRKPEPDTTKKTKGPSPLQSDGPTWGNLSPGYVPENGADAGQEVTMIETIRPEQRQALKLPGSGPWRSSARRVEMKSLDTLSLGKINSPKNSNYRRISYLGKTENGGSPSDTSLNFEPENLQ